MEFYYIFVRGLTNFLFYMSSLFVGFSFVVFMKSAQAPGLVSID